MSSLSFFKKLRREKLTADESSRLARELRAVMASYPAPTSAKMWSPGSHRLHRFGLSLVTVAVVIIATSGTALAAEQALPGDTLYPIKINLNERVRAGLTMGTEAKARWETRQVERRLDEAERLTTQGRFSEQKRVELEARFKTHVGQLGDRITELKARGKENQAERLRVQFSTRLETHEKKLRILINKTDTPSATSTTSTPRQPKSERQNGRPVHAFLQLIETTANPVRPSSTPTPTSVPTSPPREPREINTTTEINSAQARFRLKLER